MKQTVAKAPVAERPSSIPKAGQKRLGASTNVKQTARYLRDTGSHVLRSRAAPLTSHRDDVRASWSRVSGLAMDLIQNSGHLKGAVDQVIADTVGVGLTLVPMPDLEKLGYSKEEAKDWVRLVKRRWKKYWNNASEVDARGKLTGPQMVDIALRWHIAFGEATGVFDFFGPAERKKYGIETGTKLRLYPPHRLVQDTSPSERLFQGVRHDENGRAVGYQFRTSSQGFEQKKEYPAFDRDGRPVVLHVFDAKDSEDVRGISEIASAFRKHIQSEKLDDATLQMAILQTVFAITLISDAPSADAFQALEALEDQGEEAKDYGREYLEFLGSKLDRAADSRIDVGSEAQVAHLAPGEKLNIESARVPGEDYLPFSKSLRREMARAIGVTFGGFTLDHSDATYASTRMEVASLWPVALRRRERNAAPICQRTYENWLDEEIGEGRIPFKGGYEAFYQNRADVVLAVWQGPPAPSADDYKAARASSERLENGTSSIAIETGHLGIDQDELFEQRQAEHQRYVDANMPSPYAKRAQQPLPVNTDETKKGAT